MINRDCVWLAGPLIDIEPAAIENWQRSDSGSLPGSTRIRAQRDRMYILENPVLQRELLVNLRMARAFVLLLLYQSALALVVYFAWPRNIERLDLSSQPEIR